MGAVNDSLGRSVEEAAEEAEDERDRFLSLDGEGGADGRGIIPYVPN
jgi:hypothetical protein